MNENIFLFLHSLANRSEILDWSIVFIADHLPWLVIALALGFLWVHIDKNKWVEIFEVFVISIGAYAAALALKIFFATDRPNIAIDNIAPLLIKHDYAFPSGHATFFFALATAIYLRHKKAGILFFIAAILISLARIAAGAHFPSDILGGLVLGAGIAYLLKRI